jgi:hypothetical protein
MLGGNALVEQDLAQEWLPEIIAPTPVSRPDFSGYKSLSAFPKEALNRAATRKQRMRVLERDGYRCKVCGRRPADHVDAELHVHHARMWSRGGITADDNLITLCHTYHKGLEPHEDIGLFDLIEPLKTRVDVERLRREFYKGDCVVSPKDSCRSSDPLLITPR